MPPSRPARPPQRRGGRRRPAAGGGQLDDDDPRFFDGPSDNDRRRALTIFGLPLDPLPFRPDSSDAAAGDGDPSAAPLIPWGGHSTEEGAEAEGGGEWAAAVAAVAAAARTQ